MSAIENVRSSIKDASGADVKILEDVARVATHANNPKVRAAIASTAEVLVQKGSIVQVVTAFFRGKYLHNGLSLEDATDIIVDGAIETNWVTEIQEEFETAQFEIREEIRKTFQRKGQKWNA